MGCGASAVRRKLFEEECECHGTESDSDTPNPADEGRWLFEDSPDVWQSFPPELNQQLTLAREAGEKAVVFQLPAGVYEVNFEKGYQVHWETRTRRRIRFKPGKGSSAASTPMPEEPSLTPREAPARGSKRPAAADDADEYEPYPEAPKGPKRQARRMNGHWQFEDFSTGGWKTFGDDQADMLNAARRYNKSKVSYAFNGAVYQADLDAEIQINMNTGNKRRLRWQPLKQFQWEQRPGIWVDYEDDENDILVNAYVSKEPSVAYRARGYDYQADFQRMVQDNLSMNAVSRSIRIHAEDLTAEERGPTTCRVPSKGSPHPNPCSPHPHPFTPPRSREGSPHPNPFDIGGSKEPSHGMPGMRGRSGLAGRHTPPTTPRSDDRRRQPASAAFDAFCAKGGHKPDARDPSPEPGRGPTPFRAHKDGGGTSSEPSHAYKKARDASFPAHAAGGRPPVPPFHAGHGPGGEPHPSRWRPSAGHTDGSSSRPPDGSPPPGPGPRTPLGSPRSSAPPGGRPGPGMSRPGYGAGGGKASSHGAHDGPALPGGRSYPEDPFVKNKCIAVYKELCAVKTAPSSERKKMYRTMCLKWHPDKNLDDPDTATEVFQFVQSLKDFCLNG